MFTKHLLTLSLLHLTFKQQNSVFEKVCRDAPCLFIIPATLVCALFGLPSLLISSISSCFILVCVVLLMVL